MMKICKHPLSTADKMESKKMKNKDKNKRFATINESDLLELSKQKDSKNTQRVVIRATKLFTEFLDESIESVVKMSNEELNQNIRLFYASVRRTDGTEMKKKSLDAIKYGLTKYLKERFAIDLTHPVFSSCTQIYKAKVKQLKRTGFGAVEHKAVIGDSDLAKLKAHDCFAFNVATPCGLQNKVWFDIMYFMIRRGQENLRSMTKHTFDVAEESAGLLYKHQVIDEADKNHV